MYTYLFILTLSDSLKPVSNCPLLILSTERTPNYDVRARGDAKLTTKCESKKSQLGFT